MQKSRLIGKHNSFMAGLFILALLVSFCFAPLASATTYYISSTDPNRDDTGPGTISQPWASLNYPGRTAFYAGDVIKLKRGDTWTDQTFVMRGSGYAGNKIVLCAYPDNSDPLPIINPGTPDPLSPDFTKAIALEPGRATTHWEIKDIEIVGPNDGCDQYRTCGIHLITNRYDTQNFGYAPIGDIIIHDVKFSNLCLGVVFGAADASFHTGDYLTNGPIFRYIVIEACRFVECYTASIFGQWNGYTNVDGAAQDIRIHNCYMVFTDFGVTIANIIEGEIEDTTVSHSGYCDYYAGTTGILLKNVDDFTIADSCVTHTIRALGIPDGTGIDLEGGNSNIIIENNILDHNDGGGIMMLSNGDYNSDITIRNNILYNNNQNPLPGNNAEILDYGSDTPPSGGETDGIDVEDNHIYRRAGAGYTYFNTILESNPTAIIDPSDTTNLVYYVEADTEADIYDELSGKFFENYFYYTKYPDLQQAYGYDRVALRNHWFSTGIGEGRIASPVSCAVLFNANAYRSYNSDLSGMSDYEAKLHYVTYGLLEGRRASSSFDPKYYLDRYSDLEAAFGIDYRRAAYHYYFLGQFEGRVGAP